MSPEQRVRRNRVYLTLVVAASHFVLTVLGAIERLAYSAPSRYALLEQTLNSPLWTVLHGVAFIVLITVIARGRGYVTGLALATGVMGSWAFLSLLWGLSTLEPVSLAGPVLGGGIATLSYLLTIGWARAPRIQKRGD